MGRADGLPLQPQQQGDGHGQEDGAQVAELLEEQGGAGGDDDLDVRAGVDAQLGDEGQDGHAHQTGGGLHLLVIQNFEDAGARQQAQEQRVEDGENDKRALPDRDLDLTDGIRDQDEHKGQQVDEPLAAEPLPQGCVGVIDLLSHGCLLAR